MPATLAPNARASTGRSGFTMLPSSADMNVPTPPGTRTHQRSPHSGGGSLDAIGELPRGEPRRGEVFGTPLLDARPAPTETGAGTGNGEPGTVTPLGATVRGSPFPVPGSLFSRFPIPDSRFPIPDSRFPIPDSRFPIPDSRPTAAESGAV